MSPNASIAKLGVPISVPMTIAVSRRAFRFLLMTFHFLSRAHDLYQSGPDSIPPPLISLVSEKRRARRSRRARSDTRTHYSEEVAGGPRKGARASAATARPATK